MLNILRSQNFFILFSPEKCASAILAYSCLCFVALEFRLHSDSVRATGYRKETKKAGIYFCWYVCPSAQPVTASYQIIVCLSQILQRLQFRYLSHDLNNAHCGCPQFRPECVRGTEGTAIRSKNLSSHCQFSTGNFNSYLTSSGTSCYTAQNSFWLQLLSILSGFSKHFL